MLLVGDIGGTKTVLALFELHSLHTPLVEATFPSGDHSSLEEIIAAFLANNPADIQFASFGVAGPVVNGRARITNLPWVIDSAVIGQTFHIPQVHLLNDLEAVASAVPHLRPDDLATLNEGVAIPHSPIGVIAPGTGLGEGFLVWTGHHYRAVPSEGGHTSFGPTNERQVELLNYLLPRLGRVSYERVCSGIGIPNLYNFLRDTGLYPEPAWLKAEIAAADDPTPVIMNTAVSGKAPICQATLNLFVEILGDEAGNLALKVMATGGIYLGGGIPPRILPHLQSPTFLLAFTNKGRFSELLSRIPVHVIRNSKVALLGAAYGGMAALEEGNSEQ